jgi:hypothetical protein
MGETIRVTYEYLDRLSRQSVPTASFSTVGDAVLARACDEIAREIAKDVGKIAGFAQHLADSLDAAHAEYFTIEASNTARSPGFADVAIFSFDSDGDRLHIRQARDRASHIFERQD